MSSCGPASVCRSVGLSVCPCVCLSVCLPAGRSACLPVCPHLCCMLVCRPVGLSVGRSVGRSASVCLSACVPACQSVGLSACLSARRPVGLSLAPSHRVTPPRATPTEAARGPSTRTSNHSGGPVPPRGPAACPCRCGRGVGDPELLKAPRGVFARPRRMSTGKKNAKLNALQR